MTETIRHREDEKHAQAMACTTAADVLDDTEYDGSEESILFLLEPDGTHTIPPRDVNRMVEVYPYPRLWPEISDEHKALMRRRGPRWETRAVIYDEYKCIPMLEHSATKYVDEYLTERLYSGGRPKGGNYFPTGFGGNAFLPYDPEPSAPLPKMKIERCRKKSRKAMERDKQAALRRWADRQRGGVTPNDNRLMSRDKERERSKRYARAVLLTRNSDGSERSSEYEPKIHHHAIHRGKLELNTQWQEWDAYWDGWRVLIGTWWALLKREPAHVVGPAMLEDIANHRAPSSGRYDPIAQEFRKEARKRFAEVRMHGEPQSEEDWGKIVSNVLTYLEDELPAVYIKHSRGVAALTYLTKNTKAYGDLKAAMARQHGEKPAMIALYADKAAEETIGELGDGYDSATFIKLVRAKVANEIRRPGDTKQARLNYGDLRDKAGNYLVKSSNWRSEEGLEFGVYLSDEDNRAFDDSPTPPEEGLDYGQDPAVEWAKREHAGELKGAVEAAHKVAEKKLTKKQHRVWAAFIANPTCEEQEIAEQLGMSKQAFSQTKKRALAKIRSALMEESIDLAGVLEGD